MQTAPSCFVQPLLTSKPNHNHNAISLISCPPKHSGNRKTTFGEPLRAASVAYDPSVVDYESPFSVFPAEACETVGGDACAADIYPETRLEPQPKNEARQAAEQEDREHFDYTSESKSVLKGEACDDLGGAFCEAPYTSGVY